ncbi:MAG: DUF481 domain-containing protein [Pseudomonadota bacterium]
MTKASAQDVSSPPDIARALLDAAYATGDPDEIRAVARAVKTVFPDYEQTIDAEANAKIAEFTPPEPPADEAAPDASPPGGGVFAIRPWKGKISAGASLASGNSDNSALGVSIDAERQSGDFVHNVDAYFDTAESNGSTNQKRWGGAYKLDYLFSERTFGYGRVAYEEDEFSGFSYRIFSGLGIGHYLYKDEPFSWKIEGGPGFRYSLIDESTETEQEFAAFGSSEVDWVIREGVVFEQDVNVTWTSPTTTIRSISSLKTDITDAIAIAISYEYRFETDPPPQAVRTDQIARASLVYGF